MRAAAANGKLLYSIGETERVEFEVKARRDYFDTQRIRDVRHAALAERYGVTG